MFDFDRTWTCRETKNKVEKDKQRGRIWHRNKVQLWKNWQPPLHQSPWYLLPSPFPGLSSSSSSSSAAAAAAAAVSFFRIFSLWNSDYYFIWYVEFRSGCHTTATTTTIGWKSSTLFDLLPNSNYNKHNRCLNLNKFPQASAPSSANGILLFRVFNLIWYYIVCSS